MVDVDRRLGPVEQLDRHVERVRDEYDRESESGYGHDDGERAGCDGHDFWGSGCCGDAERSDGDGQWEWCCANRSIKGTGRDGRCDVGRCVGFVMK